MHRTISNYKITKRKDGRYYIRLQDEGGLRMSEAKKPCRFTTRSH